MSKIKTLVFSLCLISFAGISHADGPEPGKYDISVTMEIPGLGGTRTHQMQQCLTAEQIGENPQAWMAQMQDQDECKLVDHNFGDGRMMIHMECSTDQGDATFRGEGTYSDGTYRMTQKMTITGLDLNGATMEMTTQVVGTRIGDC